MGVSFGKSKLDRSFTWLFKALTLGIFTVVFSGDFGLIPEGGRDVGLGTLSSVVVCSLSLFVPVLLSESDELSGKEASSANWLFFLMLLPEGLFEGEPDAIVWPKEHEPAS